MRTGRLAAGLCALALAYVAAVTGDVAAASAAASCLPGLPQTAADYQAIADRRSPAWGVGDLTSMVDLPDGRRLFLFGDTGYYALNGDGSRGPLTGFGNNSAWVQSGNCFTLLDRPEGNRSWIEPPEQDGTVYWPGGGVVVGNRLHVFLTRLRLDNMWGTPLGSAVATFELPSLELARIASVPFHPARIFGSGAVYDGGYLYAYGSQRRSCLFCFAGDLYVARVPEDSLQMPAAWRFWSNGGWSGDVAAASPVATDIASNTNVHAWRNGFLLVTKTLNIVGPDVDAWWSAEPIGPWRKLGTLFEAPTPPPSRVAGYSYRDPYTYMATVSPSASLLGGGVLAAYNVGSFDHADGVRDGLMYGPRFVSVRLPDPPAAGPRVRVATSTSPWEPIVAVDRIGRVRTAGGNVSYHQSHTTHAVGVARTATGKGSWAVASDGGVFAVGDALFYGSTGGMRLNKPVVGIAATPTGQGYWLVASDGGVFSFGDAQFYGSTGSITLNRPILGMAATPTGRGYWLVASDGGVFSFGDARFHGSTGAMRLSFPVTDLAPTPTGRGYSLVTLGGQVYAFGDARFYGNVPWPPAAAVVGLAQVPGGYRMVDTNGTVHHFGASRGASSVGTAGVPIVAIASG